MQVKIIRMTANPVDAIASAFAITRGLTYEEYLRAYLTEEKKQQLITDCYDSGHMSGFEFADIDFEAVGVSRVFEVDKVRSRIASYEVEAGAFTEKRNFETVVPPGCYDEETVEERLTIIRGWNLADKEKGIEPRKRRYWTHQGLSRRMRIKKNFRNLIETGWQRMCANTQWEYREFMDRAKAEVDDVSPFLANFMTPKCSRLGYCPEKWNTCGQYPRREDVLRAYYDSLVPRTSVR